MVGDSDVMYCLLYAGSCSDESSDESSESSSDDEVCLSSDEDPTDEEHDYNVGVPATRERVVRAKGLALSHSL